MAGTEDIRIIDPSKRLKIRRNPDIKVTNIEPISVPDLLTRTAENYPDHPALKQRNPVTKEWETITYSEYKERVKKMAKVFIKLGLERHYSVAILAFNSVEWFVSELAAIHAGGIATGIYTSNSVEATQHVIETSRANIVIVDETKQMEKIREIKHKLPNLKAVVQTLPPYAQYVKKEDGYWRWSEIEEFDTDDVEEEYQKRLKSITPDECCCLVYTSGTTGKPKGAMLCHDNFTWITNSVLEFQPNVEMGKEVIISFLPLSHVAAQTLDIYASLFTAGTVYFADRDALKGSLIKTLNDARPTAFLAVPRVYEKIQEMMMQAGSQSNFLVRMIGSWAKGVTLQYHMDRKVGNYNSGIQYKIASKLLLNRVKYYLGFDRTKFLLTGAAPMNEETKKYFYSLDMPVMEAYGMSESSGVHIIGKAHDPSFESIGRTLPGLETKIHNPNAEGHGEICKRGRNVFMGYIGELNKTIEAIDDEGWLHTGDIGYIDDKGFLFITGRTKELVITAGGENIPPVHIENLVKAECHAISNAFLVGDKRKYLTILIALKTEMSGNGAPKDELAPESLKLMHSLDLNYTKLSEILNAGPDEKVTQAIQDAITRANTKSISNAQKVQKFAFLPHDFSIITGELGPTLKLKRGYVAEKYHDIIEKLYS